MAFATTASTFPLEVPDHLVPGDGSAHPAPDVCRIERHSGAPGGLVRDAFEPRLGRREQRLALARTLVGRQRAARRSPG